MTTDFIIGMIIGAIIASHLIYLEFRARSKEQKIREELLERIKQNNPLTKNLTNHEKGNKNLPKN